MKFEGAVLQELHTALCGAFTGDFQNFVKFSFPQTVRDHLKGGSQAEQVMDLLDAMGTQDAHDHLVRLARRAVQGNAGLREFEKRHLGPLSTEQLIELETLLDAGTLDRGAIISAAAAAHIPLPPPMFVDEPAVTAFRRVVDRLASTAPPEVAPHRLADFARALSREAYRPRVEAWISDVAPPHRPQPAHEASRLPPASDPTPAHLTATVPRPPVSRPSKSAVGGLAPPLLRVAIPLLTGALLGAAALHLHTRQRAATSERERSRVQLFTPPALAPATNGGLGDCLRSGANEELIYTNITTFVTIHDEPTTRHTQIRTAYSVVANRTILASEKVFKEWYSTASNEIQISRWHGNETEEMMSTQNRHLAYWVHPALQAGETRTIVTGANYLTPLPLPKDRKALGRPVDDPELDFWVYPNDDAHICELSIVFASDNRTLSVSGALQRKKNGESQPTMAVIDGGDQTSPIVAGSQSVSARWHNLVRGDDVALIVRVHSPTQ